MPWFHVTLNKLVLIWLLFRGLICLFHIQCSPYLTCKGPAKVPLSQNMHGNLLKISSKLSMIVQYLYFEQNKKLRGRPFKDLYLCGKLTWNTYLHYVCLNSYLYTNPQTFKSMHVKQTDVIYKAAIICIDAIRIY